MMRSLYAGVSGLRNHQIKMDVIGNNIANVNTVGFKKSRVTFQEMLVQTMRGASAPQGGRGGTNPRQVGLGMTLGSIDVIHTIGNSQTTEKMSDLMIQGEGFFLIKNDQDVLYTRAGNFDFDDNGYLVNPTGLKVQGWMAQNGVIDDTKRALADLKDIKLNIGENYPAVPSDSMVFSKNLDAGAQSGAVVTVATRVVDSLGREYPVTITFTKAATPNQWDYEITLPPGETISAGATGSITFNTSGGYDSTTATDLQFTPADGAADQVTVAIDFSAVTQYAAPSTVEPDTNGNPSGILQSYTIDASGVITGSYSNGLSRNLAKIAVANFTNPAGLLKAGENSYRESNNSGAAQIGAAGTGGRGSINPSTLEMSNVDLSQEFVDMITTQRGFQANSRVITASDEMLQELTNLKR